MNAEAKRRERIVAFLEDVLPKLKSGDRAAWAQCAAYAGSVDCGTRGLDGALSWVLLNDDARADAVLVSEGAWQRLTSLDPDEGRAIAALAVAVQNDPGTLARVKAWYSTHGAETREAWAHAPCAALYEVTMPTKVWMVFGNLAEETDEYRCHADLVLSFLLTDQAILDAARLALKSGLKVKPTKRQDLGDHAAENRRSPFLA